MDERTEDRSTVGVWERDAALEERLSRLHGQLSALVRQCTMVLGEAAVTMEELRRRRGKVEG